MERESAAAGTVDAVVAVGGPPAAAPSAAVDPNGAAADPDGATVDPDGTAVDGAAVDPDGAVVAIGGPPAGAPSAAVDPNSATVDPNGAAVDPDSATVDPEGAAVDGAAADPDGVGGDPDGAAVDGARAGDAAAFEVLVVRYQKRLVNYAAALLGDPCAAEDAAQEAFVRAWRGLGRFRGESSFRTWLYRIATNVARTHRERRGRQARVAGRSLDDETEALPADEVPSAEVDVETSLVTREAIDRALAELPEELRLALVLRDVEGLDYKAIASVTAAPIGTVESRIFRARRRLRTLLRPPAGARPAPGRGGAGRRDR